MLSTYHRTVSNIQPNSSPLFLINQLQESNTHHPNSLLLKHAEQNLHLGQQQFQGKYLGIPAYNKPRFPQKKVKAPSKRNKPSGRAHRSGRATAYIPNLSNCGLSFYPNEPTLLGKTQPSTDLDKPLIRTHRDKRASSYIPNSENIPLSEKQQHNSFPIKTPVIKQQVQPYIIGIGFMSRPKFSNIPPTIPYLSPPSSKTEKTIPEETTIKQGTLCERLEICRNWFKHLFFELLPQSPQLPRAKLKLYSKACSSIRTEANIEKCLNVEPRSVNL